MKQAVVLGPEANVVCVGRKVIDRAGVLALIIEAQRGNHPVVAADVQPGNGCRIRVEQRKSLRAESVLRNDIVLEMERRSVGSVIVFGGYCRTDWPPATR